LLSLDAVAWAADEGVAGAMAAARRGRYEEALTALDGLVQAGGPDCGEARLELARLLWRLGRRQQALGHFTFLVDDHNARKPTAPESLTWAGAAGAYTGSSQQAIRILELAQKADPDDVRPFVEAGNLFLDKFQTVDAAREFDKVLQMDPENADALLGQARVAFGEYRFDEMKRWGERALKADPFRYEVHRLRARVLLLEDETSKAARAELEAALSLNPFDPDTLALMAAVEYLAGAQPRFNEMAARALKVNPLCAAAYQEAAEVLRRLRRRREAETLFLRALQVDPEHVPSLDSLGGLLLAEGREVEGRALLEQVYRMDPFRVPVVNLLKTLDLMDEEFVTGASGAVLYRYHPWRDAALQTALPEFAVASLRTLGAAPGFSTGALPTATDVLVEVLPEHRWFSARLVGVPWNGPVGACQGRLVILDSSRQVSGQMSWRQVMHHELAHAEHLAATEGRLPNWFTEGLAVYQEGTPRPMLWDQLLARARRMGQLLPFDGLNRGFLSPRNPGDWTLAYCQAELVIEFVVQRFGPLAPWKMLQAYARGLKGGEVFREALGLEPARFAEEVEAHWEREAAAVPVTPVYYPGDAKRLEERLAQSGAPAEAAELARALLQLGDAAGCGRVLREALNTEATDPDCLGVAGLLYLERKLASRAVSCLEKAASGRPGNPELRTALARARLEAGDTAGAVVAARESAALYRRDPEPVRMLVVAARRSKDTTGLKDALEQLRTFDPAAVDCRVELATLALARKQPAEALLLLDEARDLDPCGEAVCAARARVFEALGKTAEARGASRDRLSARFLAGLDGTPPVTTVQALEAEARAGDGPGPQGAADLLSLLPDPASLEVLRKLSTAGTPEVAHRAAIGLGRRGDGEAATVLVKALDCSDCRAEAQAALAGLAARPPDGLPGGWKSWLESHRSGSPTGWLEEAAQPLGVPLRGSSGKPRQAALLLLLDDSRWYVRVAALAEFHRLTGKAFGRGTFGPEGDSEPALARARREALARWTQWLKEN
jgi:tetratricopeptide (TPR) repeat protein